MIARYAQRVGAGLALFGFLAFAAGCAREATPRLVLLYLPCTLNAERLSPYAPDVPYTPHVDAFSRQGVVYERHQTESGHSGVAYASIFAGRHADGHGVFSHPTRLADENYTLTEAFVEAGYDTWFWGGQPMARIGYAQGVPRDRVFEREMRIEELEQVLAWLAAEPGARALLINTFTLTHSPYDASKVASFCERYAGVCARMGGDAEGPVDAVMRWHAVYQANALGLESDFPATVRRLGLSESDVAAMGRALEIVYASLVNLVDERFGELMAAIDAAGLAEESLVVYGADHGEALYRDNALFKWTHGWELAPEVLRVPFILRGPGLAAGTRVEAVTRSVDVFPTVAALAGVALPAEESAKLRGVDVSAGATAGMLAYSHTPVMDPRFRGLIHGRELWQRYHEDVGVPGLWVSVRDGDLVTKYRNLDGERWGFEVFDLASDPEERRNLYDPDNPEHRERGAALGRYRDALRAGWDRRGEPQLDEHTREALRALGYID